VLTETQYEQMAAMNLYPGKKEILLEKTNSETKNKIKISTNINSETYLE
jgi:hypothetical protein